MTYPTQDHLIRYLQEELLVPADAIALAIRQQHTQSSQLHIILWQFGFISLQQLNQIFEWLEQIEPQPETGLTQAA